MPTLLLLLSIAGSMPPVDRMIHVSGMTLHLVCEGDRASGAPLVVFEAGAGNSTTTWTEVFGAVAARGRACAYDRPGLGASAPGANAQPARATVVTLHALLQAAGEGPPYILVGHSYGGMIVRLYATEHPAEVAGVVLIDSSHEEQLKRFAALPPAPAPASPPPGVPEQVDISGMSVELARAPWRADIPLVVLTRTDRPVAGNPRGAIWQELQRELATRSPQAEHIVAPNSGHYIQIDEPALVIDAIQRVRARLLRPARVPVP